MTHGVTMNKQLQRNIMTKLIAASQSLTLITVIVASAWMLLDIMMMHQGSLKGLISLVETFPQ